MAFDSEWQLAGCMKTGMRGSGYPAGWLSEKKPCPFCEKPVAGRHTGMAEHIAAKHGMKRREALDYTLSLGLRYRDSDRDPEGAETGTGSVGEADRARAEGIARSALSNEGEG